MKIRKWKLEHWTALCVCVGTIVFSAMLVIANAENYQSKLLYGFGSVMLTLLIPRILWRMKIELPGAIKALISLFMFLSMVLGRMLDFYEMVPGWDIFLHVYSGALLCVIGFRIMIDLPGNTVSAAVAAFGGFCLALALGVAWEYFEYAVDILLGMNSQVRSYAYELADMALADYVDKWKRIKESGLEDTMGDLIANGIGAAGAGWVMSVKKRRIG